MNPIATTLSLPGLELQHRPRFGFVQRLVAGRGARGFGLGLGRVDEDCLVVLGGVVGAEDNGDLAIGASPLSRHDRERPLLDLVDLVWSVSSSLHFWLWSFRDPIYAYGAVLCIDALALIGLLLHLARIASPLVQLRHTLPFVSALPLAFDMHGQFAHLGNLSWVFTTGITTLLVVLSFIVWRTIERQFISPVEAAREYAQQQMQALHIRSVQLQVMQEAADEFVQANAHRALGQMQLPARVQTYARPADAPTVQVSTTRLHDAPQPAPDAPAWMHDAHATMQTDAAPMQTDAAPAVHEVSCLKCGAPLPVASGKNPVKARATTARFGCRNCR